MLTQHRRTANELVPIVLNFQVNTEMLFGGEIMYYQLMREIEEKGIAKITRYDKDCQSAIEGWNLDINFKRALQWYWFAFDVEVGPTLYGVQRIVEYEAQTNHLESEFLSIGRGPNGDELLIHSKTLGVYFWNHTAGSDEETVEISDCIKLYNHILILIIKVRNQNYIPWDSFAARAYYEIYRGI